MRASKRRRHIFRALVCLFPLAACLLCLYFKSALVRIFLSCEERILQDAFEAIPTISTLADNAHPVLSDHIDESQLIDHFMGQPKVVFLQEPGHKRSGHRYIYDPLLGWRNIPNWQATTRGKSLTINSLGLRDKEHPYVKSPGIKRVLVLGDSFTWGYGVSDGATFSDVLETLIAETEVLNSGVSGWGTDQEYLYLVSEGFRYSPDLVILAFYMENDIKNNMSSMQYRMHKPYFLDEGLKLGNVPVPPPASPPVRVKSARAIWITIEIIGAIHSFCNTINADFLLCLFGVPESESDKVISARILDRATRLPNGYSLDLDWAIARKKIPKEALIAGNEDGHWNAFGHQMVAQLIDEFIKANEIFN